MREETVNWDAGVLDRFAQGEPAAFAQIVREHQGMVFSLALHFLKEPSLSEDLAQEVFLQLYQNRAAIKSAAHLRFWLRKVACHRSMDCARRSGPRRTISLEDAPEPVAAQPAGDLLLDDRLWRLVGTLPEKSRMALILRYQEDLTYQEIAEVMEMPLNTVKTSLERGLALLREKLTRSLGGVRA
ncbi:MAG: RNA polymerase sigma factor [Terriglobia bacterium]